MDLVDWQQRFERWILTHHAQDDAAHDLSHFRRVWATATQLAAGRKSTGWYSRPAIFMTSSACQNHPERSRSSMMAAEKTLAILQSAFADFPADRYPAVSHAIEAHSFSAAIPPRTLEAKIVQDADRLESLGAIGLARVFAVAGALNTILFDAEDPLLIGGRWMTANMPSTISSANFCACRKPCKLTRGKRWRSIMPVFSSNLWLSSARSCREPLALDEAVLRRFAPQASTDR